MHNPPSSPSLDVPSAMDRWQWIVERVPSPEEQRNLALLARVIEVDFGGRVEREKDLTAFMAERYRWGNKTTRRRAMRLAEIDVVRWVRSERDHWTKVYELVPEADLMAVAPQRETAVTAP